MTRAWRRWAQPSLTRRLVLAQMATAALLWLALAAYSAGELEAESAQGDLAQMRLGAAMVLPLAEALHGQPELLRQTLARVDAFQRANVTPVEGQSMLRLPAIYLWWDGQVIYRSSDAPARMDIARHGALVDLAIDGQPWRAYAEASASGRARFAALAPASPEASGLTPWSRGWLVLPLLVSLPILVLPAWLSVRFALRPWARLSAEVAARGPEDLSPLAFVPAHRELAPLTRAVDQLLDRLRRVRERERRFVADAAHELRTPIAAVQVNAEALRERGLAAADGELLEGLLKSNARAARLVAQLLSLTRSDASALAPALSVDLELLLQESLAQFEATAQQHDVELDLETEPGITVMGDGESLRMLVDNLIGNAIKYSPPGALVCVRAFRQADALSLQIIDQGPGIEPAFRDRVFDRFFRAAGQAQTGSGLGLSIVKAVAERHGAAIALADRPQHKGLCVTVSFPVQPARPDAGDLVT